MPTCKHLPIRFWIINLKLQSKFARNKENWQTVNQHKSRHVSIFYCYTWFSMREINVQILNNIIVVVNMNYWSFMYNLICKMHTPWIKYSIKKIDIFITCKIRNLFSRSRGLHMWAQMYTRAILRPKLFEFARQRRSRCVKICVDLKTVIWLKLKSS